MSRFYRYSVRNQKDGRARAAGAVDGVKRRVDASQTAVWIDARAARTAQRELADSAAANSVRCHTAAGFPAGPTQWTPCEGQASSFRSRLAHAAAASEPAEQLQHHRRAQSPTDSALRLWDEGRFWRETVQLLPICDHQFDAREHPPRSGHVLVSPRASWLVVEQDPGVRGKEGRQMGDEKSERRNRSLVSLRSELC